MRLLLVSLVLCLACGVQPSADLPTSPAVAEQEITDDNGLDHNGLDHNGLDHNGLDHNGLDHNGFTTAFADGTVKNSVASSSDFANWYATAPYASSFMYYFARCALPAGATLKYGAASWSGLFGLAPNWVTSVPTLADQQRVSACLLAHVNAAGVHVTVSFGSDRIANAADTAAGYTVSEGMFFGNVFGPTPKVYACNFPSKAYTSKCGGATVGWTQASLAAAPTVGLVGQAGRTCAANASTCGMTYAGNCDTVCPQNVLGSCSADGVSYTAPVQTYLKRPTDNNVCLAIYY
jgi:hypothetical protein